MSLHHIRVYPDLLLPRTRAVLRDVLLVALLLVCLLIGRGVHAAVLGLQIIPDGIVRTGEGLDDGFRAVGSGLGKAPFVGDDIRDKVDEAGRSSGGSVARAGERGHEKVSHVATVLGWVAGGIPAALILLQLLPGRVRQVRQLTAANRVLVAGAAGDDPERTRVLAMRAAFHLPYADLAKVSRDPFGDLARGEHAALVAALAADSGLRVPAPTAAGA